MIGKLIFFGLGFFACLIVLILGLLYYGKKEIKEMQKWE